MLHAKLDQSLRFSGLKNPLQSHAILKDLLFKAHKVSDCETTSVLHRAQSHFSHKAKGKALISAISEAAVASLSTAKASI